MSTRFSEMDSWSRTSTPAPTRGHTSTYLRTSSRAAARSTNWPPKSSSGRPTSSTFDELDLDDTFVERSDIRRYEREHGRIRPGSLVILKTGAEEFWGAEEVLVDEDDNAANVDDFFDFENAGFSGAAVQWMFDNRDIDGVGSDAYGPDAFDDGDFLATFTALENDGVALVAIANLDSMSVRGDVIMAPTVALSDGSGFTTDPIACHSADAPGLGAVGDDRPGRRRTS